MYYLSYSIDLSPVDLYVIIIITLYNHIGSLSLSIYIYIVCYIGIMLYSMLCSIYIHIVGYMGIMLIGIMLYGNYVIYSVLYIIMIM